MMNEQMKQLMGQTLDEKFSGTWSTMDMQDLQKFAERFAELIVKECMSLVSEPGPDMNDTERGILAQIKQHFGVEL
jgi:hypothetical protein